MSYVYMKSLENKAEKYDKGIQLLTLGKLSKIKDYIIDNYLRENEEILDIGMGTGSFAIACAEKGYHVFGIDQSEKMLEVGKKKISKLDLSSLITIFEMPIIDLDKKFPNDSFDKVTAILVLSELYEKEMEFCIRQVHRILKLDGEFIILDEVKPKKMWKRIIYALIRIPLLIVTFFSTHLTTHPLKEIIDLLKKNNFLIIEEKEFLLDSLKLIRAKKK